jgi:hypothetical protein
MSVSAVNRETYGADHAQTLFQPFQEGRQDPEPTGCGPTGAVPQEQSPQEHDTAISLPAFEDEEVTEDAYTAARDGLVAQGTDPAFLIRPVILTDARRVRQEAAPRSAAAPEQTPEVPATIETPPARVTPRSAPALCSPALQTPRGPVPACARAATRVPPPTLRNVTLADLGDVERLLELHAQAIARGWLRGGEAVRLNVVAAAVHARRVGQAPCRLFVALLRDQRWEVITQEDEDQARRLLREHRDGPCPRSAAPAAMPAVPMPDDARFALLAEQVLRQAGWRGEPFLAVQMQYPMWTRERWEQAQAELTQWRLRQVRARWQRSGLEPLAEAPWEESNMAICAQPPKM